MTRINTNVSSLNAQKSLGRSNLALQEALTRLSTGLRINTGKDDPAGLIASEVLRSDIISVEKAITNSQRANQVIATADSSLGQVSGLLNDIRGLVTEAANTGALSEEQIAANQLQVDSSLSALNRIAQTTSFQGRRLLDGSFDFLTNATSGQNFDDITDLDINQATLDPTAGLALEIEISAAATKAQITNNDNVDAAATATLDFGYGYQLDNSGSASIGIYQLSASTIAAPKIELKAAAAPAAVALGGADILEITLDNSGAGAESTAGEVVNLINNTAATKSDWFAYLIDTSGKKFGTAAVAVDNMEQTTLKVDALNNGADYNNLKIEIAASSGAAIAASYATATNTITIVVDSDAGAAKEDDLTTIVSKIEAIVDGSSNQLFDATESFATDGRQGVYGASAQDSAVTGNSLYTGGGVLKQSLVFELSGNEGVEVFNFSQYTKISAMVAAVNLVSDATGVSATDNSGTLEFDSEEYGTDAFVAVKVISEGTGGTFETSLNKTRDEGTDIDATVNGYTANGDGNTLSVNVSTLDMSATIAATKTDTIKFTITGGGALFQLGPDVVANQQARIGISSVNTTQLGGVSGDMYQIGSGQSAALATDAITAAKIVDEAIAKVASLRGRLGAFQKTTVDTNINSLSDTLENLTDAESSIRDADFAAESAALTRAQILVQSGTSVLAIANSNPQNVLALLR